MCSPLQIIEPLTKKTWGRGSIKFGTKQFSPEGEVQNRGVSSRSFLRRADYMTKLDLKNAYYAVPIHPGSNIFVSSSRGQLSLVPRPIPAIQMKRGCLELSAIARRPGTKWQKNPSSARKSPRYCSTKTFFFLRGSENISDV